MSILIKKWRKKILCPYRLCVPPGTSHLHSAPKTQPWIHIIQMDLSHIWWNGPFLYSHIPPQMSQPLTALPGAHCREYYYMLLRKTIQLHPTLQCSRVYPWGDTGETEDDWILDSQLLRSLVISNVHISFSYLNTITLGRSTDSFEIFFFSGLQALN